MHYFLGLTDRHLRVILSISWEHNGVPNIFAQRYNASLDLSLSSLNGFFASNVKLYFSRGV